MDVQADLLEGLATRVAVPLLPETVIRGAATGLNPVFVIDGQRFALMVQSIATVPRRELRTPIASLNGKRDPILAEIDFMLAGF